METRTKPPTINQIAKAIPGLQIYDSGQSGPTERFTDYTIDGPAEIIGWLTIEHLTSTGAITRIRYTTDESMNANTNPMIDIIGEQTITRTWPAVTALLNSICVR